MEITEKHIGIAILIVIFLIIGIILIKGSFLNDIKTNLAEFTKIRNNQEIKNERIISKGYDAYNVEFKIPRTEISEDFRKNRKRVNSLEYLTPTNPYVLDLANQLKKVSEEQNNDTVLYVIRFVQDIPYETDMNVGFDEYPKYPTETLFEGRGDCEDKSYLLYSLLEVLGYDVGIILLPGHAVVGIVCDKCEGKDRFFKQDNGKKYFIVETTTRATVGYLSPQFENEIIDFIKTDNNSSTKSITCFWEEEKYNITKYYMVNVTYYDTIEWEEQVPNPKQVPLTYSVTKANPAKLGFWECTFTYGAGGNCYKWDFTIINTDNKDGNFQYTYEITGSKGNSKKGSDQMYLKSKESKSSGVIIFDSGGDEVVATTRVTVIPPKKEVIEYDTVFKKKVVERVVEEQKSRTVTKANLKYRCI